MERTIIAVYGRGDEGKSQTVKLVCEQLLMNYPNAIPNKVPTIKGDILITIQLDNVKIGLESQGDPGSRMHTTVNDLADPEVHACDIIVCASRTGGKSVKTIDAVADRHDFHTLWISSFFSPKLDSTVLNRFAALNIIELIKSLIIGQLREP